MWMGQQKVKSREHLPRYNKVVQAYCTRESAMYGKPTKWSGAYQVRVQLSCGVCAKVPKEDHLRPVQSRFAGDHTDAVQVQGSGERGREHDTGSRTPANQSTIKKWIEEWEKHNIAMDKLSV